MVPQNNEHTTGVLSIFVVLSSLKVGEWSRASSGEGHHLDTLIDQAFGVQLTKHPPDALHIPRIQSLVVITEVCCNTGCKQLFC